MSILVKEKTEFRTRFAHVLKRKRLAINYSHDDLAKMCNVGRTQIVNIENKYAMPSMYVGIKLCALLNIDLINDLGMRIRFDWFDHHKERKDG